MIVALIVLFVLVAILALMVPRLRPTTGSMALNRYGAPNATPGGVSGAVAAVALASFCGTIGVIAATAVTVGVLVGLSTAMLRGLPRQVLLGACGLLGSIGAVLGYLADASCTGDLYVRLLALGLMAIAAAGGGVVAVVTGRLAPASALAAFATIEVLAFLSSPLGASIFDTSVLGVALAVIVAASFGFFAFVAPVVVIGLGAVAIGVASLGISAGVGSVCSSRSQFEPLIVLAAFCVAFAPTRGLRRIVHR